MKRALSIILVVGLLCLLCTFSVEADEAGTGISVNQTHASYAQWSNQSPMHMGSLSGTDSLHPISLAIPSTVIGNISSATAPSVVIDVSDPLIGKKDTIVYVGFYEAYGVFHGSNSMPTYFVWSDDIPGYTMRAAASTSYGPVSPQDLTVTAPSSFSATVKRTQAGSSTGATFSSSAVSVVGTYTPVVRVPQSVGSAYMDPYWKVASNSYKVLKVTIGSDNDSYSNVRIELDTNDVSKVTGSGSSGNYLMSGVFVPLCFVVDATDYNQAQLDKLDDIINALVDLNQSVTDGFADVIQILNDNFADILASIGTSTGSRDNILFYLRSLLTYVNDIQTAIMHQSGDPGAFSSAIQYIEYYLSRVLENTDAFVEYIENITDTMEQMEQEIEDTNDAIDTLDDDVEDAHEQEQQLYEDANDAIGNLAISDFDFDGFTGQGVRAAGELFEDLWESFGVYAQVYNFTLLLTLCLTIIRYSTRRPKAKESSKGGKKQNQGGGG